MRWKGLGLSFHFQPVLRSCDVWELSYRRKRKESQRKNANFQGWGILAHFWPPKIDLFGHKWNNLEVFNLVSKKITKFATKPSKIDILVLLLYGATYFTPNFFIIVNIHAKHDVLKVQPLFYISLLLSKKKNFDFCKRRLILPHWLF